MVIMFGNYKGGVGKTALCSLCALWARHHKKTSVIVDWDNNASSARFLEREKERGGIYSLSDAGKGNIDIDYLLIDTPGNEETYRKLLPKKIMEVDRFVCIIDQDMDSKICARHTLELLQKNHFDMSQALLVTNLIQPDEPEEFQACKEVCKILANEFGVSVAKTQLPYYKSIRKAKTFTGAYPDISIFARMRIERLMKEITK